jgi:hypothetical protein
MNWKDSIKNLICIIASLILACALIFLWILQDIFLPSILLFSFLTYFDWNLIIVFLFLKYEKVKKMNKVISFTLFFTFIALFLYAFMDEITFLITDDRLPASVFSGILLFVAFRNLIPKDWKIRRRNLFALILAVFSNPIILLLLFAAFWIIMIK